MESDVNGVFRGPVRAQMVYTVPNHPYLSLVVCNQRELDINTAEISEDMIIDSGGLTAEDLFYTRGLTFKSDSILWGILAEKNCLDFQYRGGTSLTADEFIKIIDELDFELDTSRFHKILTKSVAISHFVISEYVFDGEKKDTITAHFNRILELLDSLFVQFMVLRNRSECRTILHIFDILPNPKDWIGEGNISVVGLKQYLIDELYSSFVLNTRYVTAVLCQCSRCRYRSFRTAFFKNRGLMRVGLFCDVVDDPHDLMLDELHMDCSENIMVREQLKCDLGRKMIYDAMRMRRMPILHSAEFGKGQFEKNVLKVYFNLVFALFLLRLVYRKIESEMNMLANTLMDNCLLMKHTMTEAGNSEGGKMKFAILANQFMNETIFRLPRTCFSLIEMTAAIVAGCEKSKHRTSVLLEHLCIKRSKYVSESCLRLRVTREIRYDILEGYLHPLELSYVTHPIRYFRGPDCNLFETNSWRGIYPSVVPASVRFDGSFESRIYEHRLRQRRVTARKCVIKGCLQRASDIRRARRVPRLSINPFVWHGVS